MNQSRQGNARFTLVGLSTLLLASSVLGVFFPAPRAVDAGAAITISKKTVSYTGADAPKPNPYKKVFTFGKNPTATTTISEDAGSGNKIEKIVFYKGTEAVKTINVNAQTYAGTETFNGDKIEVQSIDNGANGSWFAWNRTIKEGWKAGQSDNWAYVIPSTAAEPANEGPIVTDNPKWSDTYTTAPGKTVRLTVQYPISNAFKGVTEFKDVLFPLYMLDNRTSIVQERNKQLLKDGAKVVADYDQIVKNEKLGIQGKAALGQITLEKLLVGLQPGQTEVGPTRDLNYATIVFTQQHSDKGSYLYYVTKNSDGSMRPYDGNPKSAQIMAFYYAAYKFVAASVTYQYPDRYWVYKTGGETFGFCDTRTGRTIEGQDLSPMASAVIKADQRDREPFDVLQGIPTSESLYGNVLAKDYLHQFKFQEQKVTCIYDVPVTQKYLLKWDPGKTVANDPPPGSHTEADPQSAEDSVVYTIHTERYFTYWTVENLGIYAIDSAELNNYAFEGEQITIYPEGYVPPELIVEKNGGYTAPEVPKPFIAPSTITVTGGKTRPNPTNDVDTAQGYVEEKVGKIKGKNDKVVFKGQTLMDDREVEAQTPVPTPIPNGTPIGRDVLYSPNHMIPSSKTNRYAAPSMGTIAYYGLDANYEASDGDTYPIGGINSVTVHTPVVNYSSATDDQAHNQKTTPNASRAAFILDRPFTIRMPTSGQHANYPGYGNRDYQKYFRAKQVRFPFDTYTADRSTFYPAQTWIDIPVSRLDTTFFLPVWVDEGDYTVEFRNIAENAPDVQPGQPDANLDLTYHVASDTVGVEVIGRLYDFHLTDIVDYNWELVFRKQKGSPVHTGNTYWTGLSDLDGAPRGNASPFTLPILPGSNPLQGMKNVSVKTGYHVKFDLKTKGNMFGKTDGIRITPSFTFVSKDGKTKTPVDLYYHDDHRSFIQVGSEQDTAERYVILNERLRNVPEEELTDTARYKYDHDYTFAEVGGVSREMFVQDYIRRFTKLKTPVGGYDLLLLPEQVRTLIGPKTDLTASVDYSRANAAVQKWYGEYNLPVDPYVVAQGTNLAEYGRTHRGLTKRDPIFLRDGYIILNFNIESIRGGDLKRPHLQYMNAPLMNQWTLEGYKRSVKDSWGNWFNLRDGDIAFYNGDKSYKDDFQAQVPH
ncbi:hypothetical protein CDO73_17400 [Saccharibacillus sp. O23]|uniref:DUF5704 domain-containing protein n=1 Tax=Saccharibacillus sp. O23 TaxID=2009338 RepID=UPI000B4E5290|nr:DUF5704 domain-containing protein [Saccharibacillus sp. O23]OWR28676.1 hypothetical protein CDO73_17400 [Saccharibacillus sp. O23]